MVYIDKYYLLETNDSSYRLKITYNLVHLLKTETMDDEYLFRTANSYEIFLGGSEFCTEISIYSKDNTEAYISSLKYNTNCNITGDLERGIGTRNILNTAMNLVMNMFTWIKTFSLVDTSNKSCFQTLDKPTPSVDLGLYYLLFYKQTWYSRTFHAKLKDKFTRDKLDRYLEKLDDPTIKLPYIHFINRFFRYMPIQDARDYLVKYKIEDLYNSSNNYYEFFQKVKTAINDTTELCVFISYFLSQFMNYISNNDFSSILTSKWIISNSDVLSIDITYPLKELTQSGGGYGVFKAMI